MHTLSQMSGCVPTWIIVDGTNTVLHQKRHANTLYHFAPMHGCLGNLNDFVHKNSKLVIIMCLILHCMFLLPILCFNTLWGHYAPDCIQTVTTDVQNATVLFSGLNVMLSCQLATGSSSQYCTFVFARLMGDETETVLMPHNNTGFCAQLNESRYTKMISIGIWIYAWCYASLQGSICRGSFGVWGQCPAANCCDSHEKDEQLYLW